MSAFLNPFALGGPPTLYKIISELGLEASLVACFDAGDIACYDGSSQTWTDRVGANNMYRGTTSGSEASDPAFSGVAGAATDSEYFSFDGGDLFKETAAHTYADNWHKNNAAFTVIALYYLGTKSALSRIFDTMGALATADGIGIHVVAARTPVVIHSTSNVPAMASSTSTSTLTNSSWNFVGVAVNEAATNVDFVVNGTSDSKTFTASTATNAKAAPIRFSGYNDTPSSPLESGERYGAFAAFSSALTIAQLGNIYGALKAQRFTGLP